MGLLRPHSWPGALWQPSSPSRRRGTPSPTAPLSTVTIWPSEGQLHSAISEREIIMINKVMSNVKDWRGTRSFIPGTDKKLKFGNFQTCCLADYGRRRPVIQLYNIQMVFVSP